MGNSQNINENDIDKNDGVNYVNYNYNNENVVTNTNDVKNENEQKYVSLDELKFLHKLYKE